MGAGSEETLNDLPGELALWDGAAARGCLTGELSAVDLAAYPFIALLLRVAARRTDFGMNDFIGPRLAAWSITCRRFASFHATCRRTGAKLPGLDRPGRALRDGEQSERFADWVVRQQGHRNEFDG